VRRSAKGRSVPCEMRFRRKSEASQRTRERTDLVDGVEPRRPAEEGPRREAGFALRRRVVEPHLRLRPVPRLHHHPDRAPGCEREIGGKTLARAAAGDWAMGREKRNKFIIKLVLNT